MVAAEKKKFNLFKTNKRIFIWSCVHPTNEHFKQKYLYIFWTIFGLLSLSIGLCGTTMFCIKNLSTDTENSLEALYQMAAVNIVLCIAIIGFIKREEIKQIIDQFEEVCDACKSSIDYNETMLNSNFL